MRDFFLSELLALFTGDVEVPLFRVDFLAWPLPPAWAALAAAAAADGVIRVDCLLAVVGGVLVAALKSLAQAPAACVVDMDAFSAQTSGAGHASVDIRPSGDSDPKVDTVSQLVSGEGHFWLESGVQKDDQGAQFASLDGCTGQKGLRGVPQWVLKTFTKTKNEISDCLMNKERAKARGKND